MKNQPQKPTVIPKKFKRSHPQDQEQLEAPYIPVAFHDTDNPGLIPVGALTNPVVVTLKVWAGARPGYTYQVVWDSVRYGPEKIIGDADIPGTALALEIPVDLLTEGNHALQYRGFNPSSQVENLSEITTAVIDKTAPGSPELAQIEFPPQVQNGLTAAELAELGGVLETHIPGYTGMAKHDVVQTFWGGTEGPSVIVDQDDMGINKVRVIFTKDFLESLGSEEQAVNYRVFDRAGNQSIDSNSVSVTLKLEDIPSDFPAPIVDPAVGELIDYTEALAGVQVDIPNYPGASAFDKIHLFWGENNPLLPVDLPPGNEGEDIVLSLRVPFETINALPNETVDVYYEVFRQGDLVGKSQNDLADVFLTLPVTDPLDKLAVQGTSVENPNITDNFIDEDDYELNARAVVSWNTGFQENDDLNLYWGEQQKLQWYQIKASDVSAGRNLTLAIDNSIMKSQGTGSEIPVYYTVRRNGNPNTPKAPPQTVTVRSKEDLPGGPDGLEGPPFNLNAVGVIAPIENANGAEIEISPYININNDQKVTLTFKGFDDNNNPIEASNYTASRELDDFDVVNGYTFTVPYRNLRIICTGYAEACFKVEPPPGSNQSAVTSRTTRAPVNMLDSVELTCTLR